VASYVLDGRPQGAPVLESRGDGALHTLIHEVFHVLDLAQYFDDFTILMEGSTPKNAKAAAARKHFYDASWTPNNPFISRFKDQLDAAANSDTNIGGSEPVAGVNLVGERPQGQLAIAILKDHIELASESQGWQAHTTNRDRSAVTLSLARSSDTFAAMQRRLRVIADKTNFTSDYATGNFMEDFAVTLEHYYIGTRYGIWERVEFFAPLTPYVFTPESLLRGSTPQSIKTCAAVADFLGEECRLQKD